MGNLKPASVLHEVQHGRETWRVYRTSRRGYGVVRIGKARAEGGAE